jgi:hypothetical protein
LEWYFSRAHLQMQYDLWDAERHWDNIQISPFIAPTPSHQSEITNPTLYEDRQLLKTLLGMVSPTIRYRSGTIFYSSRSAFTGPSAIYLLGLNPGGDPEDPEFGTIATQIKRSLQLPPAWSAYKDEIWKRDYAPGGMPMQRHICHLISGLGLDIRSVPASNVAFIRSKREAALKAEKADLLRSCWPVHHAVIENLQVRAILCLGGTAGAWVRQCIGAYTFVDRFVEYNSRRWTSWAHKNADGRHVVTLTHPSIADWTKVPTDPTPFVRRILESLKHGA